MPNFIRAVRALRIALFGLPPCRHHWTLIGTSNVHAESQWGVLSELPIRIEHRLQCKKCGDVTMRKL